MKRPHKVRSPVRFRTRGDRPWQDGTVAGYHDTLKGMFVVVKDSQAGVKLKARPINVVGVANVAV